MGNEATSCLAAEHTVLTGAYETIETIHDVVAMAQHLTSARVEQMAMVAITLYFDIEEKTTLNRLLYTDVMTSTHYLLQSLRTLVRKTDVVLLHHHTFYFLLLGANLQGGQIVQSRLWDALLWRIHNTSEGEVAHPHCITIGHSAYPVPYRSIQQFIEAAHEVSQRSIITPDRAQRKSSTRPTRLVPPGEAEEGLPALARKMGVPYLSMLPRKPAVRLQQLVNSQLAHELHCYPIGRERNTLTVAMLNPKDHLVLARLRQETGLHIFPVLTHPQELQTALEQLI